MTISIKSEYACLAQDFQSKEKTRYYLTGFHVCPAHDGREGVYIVATNGHTMAIFYDQSGTCTQPKTIRAVYASARLSAREVSTAGLVSAEPRRGSRASEVELPSGRRDASGDPTAALTLTSATLRRASASASALSGGAE